MYPIRTYKKLATCAALIATLSASSANAGIYVGIEGGGGLTTFYRTDFFAYNLGSNIPPNNDHVFSISAINQIDAQDTVGGWGASGYAGYVHTMANKAVSFFGEFYGGWGGYKSTANFMQEKNAEGSALPENDELHVQSTLERKGFFGFTIGTGWNIGTWMPFIGFGPEWARINRTWREFNDAAHTNPYEKGNQNFEEWEFGLASSIGFTKTFGQHLHLKGQYKLTVGLPSKKTWTNEEHDYVGMRYTQSALPATHYFSLGVGWTF